MKTTGNAGGSHNLVLTSRRTKKAMTSKPCCKARHRPVRHRTHGPGRELRDGRLPRYASGFWVETARSPPVHEITIAGNLKTMFKGIEAVGADAYAYGAKTVGSVLINRMKVAGS